MVSMFVVRFRHCAGHAKVRGLSLFSRVGMGGLIKGAFHPLRPQHFTLVLMNSFWEDNEGLDCECGVLGRPSSEQNSKASQISYPAAVSIWR